MLKAGFLYYTASCLGEYAPGPGDINRSLSEYDIICEVSLFDLVPKGETPIF